jgi:hypothetical protein
MNWRNAFFIQAWSDYQIFRKLNENGCPRCHKLHYLQMTTEKLAKTFLCHFSGGDFPAKKRDLAFSQFLKLSKQRRGFKEQLGYERNSKAHASYVDSLIPLAEKIEKLAPVGRGLDQVNPEYPWMHYDEGIKCPAEYDFPDFDKNGLADIYRLISRLFYSVGFS